MSTVLVGLVITVVAIVSVMTIVFTQPDQPATLRRTSRRERPRQDFAPGVTDAGSVPEPVDLPEPGAQPDFVLPAGPRSGTVEDTWVPVAPLGPRDRLRSGFALMVVLTVVGTLLAIAIGTAVVVAGLNLRDALQGQP